MSISYRDKANGDKVGERNRERNGTIKQETEHTGDMTRFDI